MPQPRAPSSPPLPHHLDHHQEQTMHHSSSSSAAPSPARPEGTRDAQAGHPADNDVSERNAAWRELVREARTLTSWATLCGPARAAARLRSALDAYNLRFPTHRKEQTP